MIYKNIIDKSEKHNDIKFGTQVVLKKELKEILHEKMSWLQQENEK